MSASPSDPGPGSEALSPAKPDISDLIARLKRIEGQARGLQRMLEEGRSCDEVVQQIAAMRAALAKVAMAIIGNHFEECFVRDQDPREAIRRATEMILRLS